MVGVGYVALEALGIAPGPSYAPDVVSDTAVVIALDLLVLLAASAAGYVARRDPSSSSGTGRGR